jgi:membrane-bound ClpP family serine protease
MFKQNEGPIDRIVRCILGIAAMVVAFLVLDAGDAAAGGIVLAVVGVVLLVTAATGFCAVYKLFNFSTKK